MNYNKKLTHQIYRRDAQNSFLEVRTDMLDKGKFLFSIVKYDAKTNKQIGKYDAYLDVSEALSLANQLSSGLILRKIAIDKKNNVEGMNYKNYFLHMGGMKPAYVTKNIDFLKSFIAFATEGEPISRKLEIIASSKYAVMVKITYTPATTDEKGLIVPKRGAKGSFAFIPLSEDECFGLGEILKAHYTAYISQLYTAYGESLWKTQKITVFEPNNNYNYGK